MAGQQVCSFCRNSDPQFFRSRIESESGPKRENLFFTVVFCMHCGHEHTRMPLDPDSEENILLKESRPMRL